MYDHYQQVKNPNSKVMLSRHYAAEGRFTFTSHDSGEHTICIGTNSTRWFGGNRLVSRTTLFISCRTNSKLVSFVSACAPWYLHWGACSGLWPDCSKREAKWTSVENSTAAGPDWADYQGAGIPEGAWVVTSCCIEATGKLIVPYYSAVMLWFTVHVQQVQPLEWQE